MPLTRIAPAEVTDGDTSVNHKVLHGVNPIIFLTMGCTAFMILIIAALIVFTFLPIFATAKGNQTKYQVQSDVLTLVYNLPERWSISPMNWTYVNDELSPEKLYILQNLLQAELNDKRITRKTSITILSAVITSQNSSSNTSSENSTSIFNNNGTNIVLFQTDNFDKTNHSRSQLIISLILRYALECAKRCQTDMKASIFVKTFHSLELSTDAFRTLFIVDLNTSARKALSATQFATTMPCIVNPSSSATVSSVIMAVTYEAESELNTFISTTTESCSVCSGHRKVSNIGFSNEIIFRKVVSQYGGSTIVIIYYITDRARSAEILANNIYPSLNVTFPTMSAGQNIASLPIALNLCQGFNTIRIFNPRGYTPSFDRIVVY